MTLQTKMSIKNDRQVVGWLAGGWAIILFGLYCFWPSYRDVINSLVLLILQQIGVSLPGPLHQFLGHEAQLMGLPLSADTQAYWFVTRASGILAYLLLWLACLWGILMSSKMVKGAVDATLLYGLHEFFPLLAVTFAALHAGVLLGDSYIGFHLTELLLPFTSQYETVWTGLGIVAFYLISALIISFYVRRWIGQKTWRAFHYTTYLAVGLAIVHGLMIGSDSQSPLVKDMYILTGAVLVFATCYRVLTVQKRGKPAKGAVTVALPRQRLTGEAFAPKEFTLVREK